MPLCVVCDRPVSRFDDLLGTVRTIHARCAQRQVTIAPTGDWGRDIIARELALTN